MLLVSTSLPCRGASSSARALVEIPGSADLLQPAFMQHRQPVTEAQGLFAVVGDQQEGDAYLSLNALQLAAHAAAQIGIEGGEGLIQQQGRRRVDQGPGQSHPLLLATRELVGATLGEGGELHHLQPFADARTHLGLPEPLGSGAEGHVVPDAEMGKESVVLEHQIHRAPVRRRIGEVQTLQQDAPLIRPLEAGDQPQSGAFAAAGGAEQGEEFAGAHPQIEAFHGRIGPIAAADLPKLDGPGGPDGGTRGRVGADHLDHDRVEWLDAGMTCSLNQTFAGNVQAVSMAVGGQ